MKRKIDYPIGQVGQPWGELEKKQWLAMQSKKRDYEQEVVSKINQLSNNFEVVCYGQLNYQNEYSLYALKSIHWQQNKPCVLITGGVHGYETSGVHGALLFAKNIEQYQADFNFIIVPCVSPWGYEMIHRWNPQALDPNRSFFQGSGVAEAELLMNFCQDYEFIAHFDLHETTDSDKNEFRPALGARDGLLEYEDMIPDGFYTVGDTENPQDEFQAAIIQSVSEVTMITEPDEEGKIIGAQATQKGVINYPLKKLSLCGSLTTAPYTTTTEVYPDSQYTDAETCNKAQVAAICGGLSYILSL